MPINKPAIVKDTKEVQNKTVGVAATDSTGKYVHAMEAVVGTDATKKTYMETKELLVKQTQKFEQGNDDVKNKKKQSVVENKNESTGPKLR